MLSILEALLDIGYKIIDNIEYSDCEGGGVVQLDSTLIKNSTQGLLSISMVVISR